MTLSWPSFLAAATSASIPPRSAAPAAVAAPLPVEAVSFSGGEQAVRPAKVVTASRAAAVRARVRTGFLHLIDAAGAAPLWIMNCRFPVNGQQITLRRRRRA